MYKIDIIDDNFFTGLGLGKLIKEVGNNFTIGKIWTSVEEFLQYLNTKRSTHPDLVLIDYRMPVLLGWQVSLLLQKRFSHIKKIGFSGESDPQWVSNFLAAGCLSFIEKETKPEVLKSAIETGLKNEYYYNLYVTKEEVQKLATKPEEHLFPYELTANEYLYIQLCQSSLTNDAIADVLDIGKDLMHKKQQKLFKQFKAKNRSELVRIAIEKNIIRIYKYYS